MDRYPLFDVINWRGSEMGYYRGDFQRGVNTYDQPPISHEYNRICIFVGSAGVWDCCLS
jgi:hypothetical protein